MNSLFKIIKEGAILNFTNFSNQFVFTCLTNCRHVFFIYFLLKLQHISAQRLFNLIRNKVNFGKVLINFFLFLNRIKWRRKHLCSMLLEGKAKQTRQSWANLSPDLESASNTQTEKLQSGGHCERRAHLLSAPPRNNWSSRPAAVTSGHQEVYQSEAPLVRMIADTNTRLLKPTESPTLHTWIHMHTVRIDSQQQQGRHVLTEAWTKLQQRGVHHGPEKRQRTFYCKVGIQFSTAGDGSVTAAVA